MSTKPLPARMPHHTNPPPAHQAEQTSIILSSPQADLYNQRTGTVNLRLASHLVELASPYLSSLSDSSSSSSSSSSPTHTTLRILDNACGPLTLTGKLLKSTPMTTHSGHIHIDAVDISTDFITDNATALSQAKLPSNMTISTQEMNALDLKFEDAVFDASFTAIAIFAFPDAVKGVRELYRTLKPGGLAVLSTWKAVGWLPLLHAVERGMGKSETQFHRVEDFMVEGELKDVVMDGGFEEDGVVEGRKFEWGWWKGIEGLAEALSETLRLLVGRNWTEGEKEGMRGQLVGVLEREFEKEEEKMTLGLVREGEMVGVPMEVWTVVASKKC